MQNISPYFILILLSIQTRLISVRSLQPVLSRNVASSSHGATCTASSHYDANFVCHRALDGNMHTTWATRHTGVGSYIKIMFDQNYTIDRIRLMQRVSSLEKSKEIQLSFSDGTTQNVFMYYHICCKILQFEFLISKGYCILFEILRGDGQSRKICQGATGGAILKNMLGESQME